jgi:hypothetical protein
LAGKRRAGPMPDIFILALGLTLSFTGQSREPPPRSKSEGSSPEPDLQT